MGRDATSANKVGVHAGLAVVVEAFARSYLTSMQQHSGVEAVREELGPTEGPVFAHSMSVILLVTPPMKVTCRTFFDAEDVRALMAQALRRKEDAIGGGLVSDFMREYANMACGNLKRSLESMGLGVGLSLPFVTRGFDAVFDKATSGTSVHQAMFRARTPQARFVNRVDIEINDVVEFTKVNWDLGHTDQGGEMEFL